MNQLRSELRAMKELSITTEHCRSITHPFRKSEPTSEPSSPGQSDSLLKSQQCADVQERTDELIKHRG
jgi:hypothetical protein